MKLVQFVLLLSRLVYFFLSLFSNILFSVEFSVKCYILSMQMQGCCLTGAWSPEAPKIYPWETKISKREPERAPKTYYSQANFR